MPMTSRVMTQRKVNLFYWQIYHVAGLYMESVNQQKFEPKCSCVEIQRWYSTSTLKIVLIYVVVAAAR